MTNQEIRRRARTLMVGEKLNLGDGWFLTRMALTGSWLLVSSPAERPSKWGTLNEVLRHRAETR